MTRARPYAGTATRLPGTLPGPPRTRRASGRTQAEEDVLNRFDLLTWRLAELWRALRFKLLRFGSHEQRVRALRRHGVRIGEGCLVYSMSFSTEPYLVEIGDRVAISRGVEFLTHDATGWLFPDHPTMDVYGPIRVGSNVYFGTNCTVLPGTRIGSNCVIGSGTVVRGEVADGSVVMGNPGKVVMKTALLKQLLVNHKHRLDTRAMSPWEKKKFVRRHFGLESGREE
jgi:acetyltransferase-like isoleucine patch superfamily enzyme